MKPGETTTIYINQGTRAAVVLATIGLEVLLEYVMPNGTTALRIIDTRTDAPARGRSIGYAHMPIKWLRAIVDSGVEWDGNPQQARRRTPSAEVLLADRIGGARI
jgi:hypothetical protein